MTKRQRPCHGFTLTTSEPDPALLTREERLRRPLYVSQKRIAAAAGIDPADVSRVLNGKKSMYVDKYSRIAKAIGITMDELHTRIEAQTIRWRNWTKRGKGMGKGKGQING